jgi:hypothetical protein
MSLLHIAKAIYIIKYAGVLHARKNKTLRQKAICRKYVFRIFSTLRYIWMALNHWGLRSVRLGCISHETDTKVLYTICKTQNISCPCVLALRLQHVMGWSFKELFCHLRCENEAGATLGSKTFISSLIGAFASAQLRYLRECMVKHTTCKGMTKEVVACKEWRDIGQPTTDPMMPF